MDLEVEPKNWVLPNRIGYNKYIYNTFHPSKYPTRQQQRQQTSCACNNDVCEIPTVSLFPQQRIVRDFIQTNSPYRGILLYHELGSGKSAASIASAEGYVGKRRVFVITPASLAQNYENELLKISTLGLNLKRSWTHLKIDTKDKAAIQVLSERYAISPSFVKKDGLVWVPLYEDDIPNAHQVGESKRYSSMSPPEKEKINETILHIIRNRYTFISYNGLTQKLVSELTKKGFDDSFVVIDEVHNFVSRITNGSKLTRSLYNSLMGAKNLKMVLLSGTPIINNPYEISTLINLVRGPMQVYELKLLKNSIEPTNTQIIDKLKQDDLYQYVDEIHFNKQNNNIYVLPLPVGYARTSSTSDTTQITLKDWKMTQEKAIAKITDSLKTIPSLRIDARSKASSHYALPNHNDEFNQTFMDITDPEDPKVKNIDLFQRRILGTLSYFKTSGTEYFPTVLPNNIQYLPMTDYQFKIYADVRVKERAIDNAQKRNKNIFEEKSSVYRAFSRMVCNFVFPEEIKRIFPQDIRKLIMKDMAASDDGDDEDSDDETEKLDKSKKDLQKKTKQEYENMLSKAMKDLMTSDYLSPENLRRMYSPKYAKMLDDIQESPGSVLIYSQFRTMEGLGIFSKVLDSQGYKEIVIRHDAEDGYVIDDPEIFDPKYDHKRYVVFNSDRVKTNILMNIFNGSYSLLPDSIQKQIYALPEESRNQLYGKLAKIMMITQSGAEGISLKNVRRVLIMEYFWNSVRINQVIGRAVRTCSHEQLPVEDRNVQIFTYIMSFSKKQLENDFTLRTLDNEATTDEYILQIAQKKENIINQFLNMLKASAVDCITHSPKNKPLENGYKCYNWPINVNNQELSYTERIEDDIKILTHKRLQILKKNKGVVVSRDGKKYVMINDKIYDYFSYVHSGVLLPV